MKILFFITIILVALISIKVLPQTEDKTVYFDPNGLPQYSYLNLNNISSVFFNNGISDIDTSLSRSGFEFPKGTGKAAVYTSGLLWGTYTESDSFNVRIGGSMYRSGLQPGKIISPNVAEDPEAYHVRIYRIRPDVFPGGPYINLQTEAGIEGLTEDELRQQYERDWIEWRAEDGAPFIDVDNNGTYNPIVDIPGIENASQTIWFVANDLDTTLTYWLYNTFPIGIECQVTYWAYQNGEFLDNVYFRKYKLINKSTENFEDMYVSMWSDPDIGSAHNDFVGCDTILNLGFAYNAYEIDGTYDPLAPPAVGFCLLNGPFVSEMPNYTSRSNSPIHFSSFNLPMTSFYYFSGGWPIEGALGLYHLMQGRMPFSGEPFINPITGDTTNYLVSGDPLTGEGWIDGYLEGPGDRRLGVNAGPFNMAVSDTQEIVIAEIAALGLDHLNSLKILKYYTGRTINAYESGYITNLAPKPISPDVQFDDATYEVRINWHNNSASIDSIENFNKEGFTFQGYNVYQFPSSAHSLAGAVKVATYDIVDGVTKIYGTIMDSVTGLPVQGVVQNGSDSGIKRDFITSFDFIKDEHMIVGKSYYFAVTAYTYNPDPSLFTNTSESIINIFEVVYYKDLEGAGYGDPVQVNHVSGTGRGEIIVSVADPTKLTGHDYEVTFHQQLQIRDQDGNWVPVSTAKNKNSADPDTLTGTTIDIGAVYSPDGVNIQLNFHLEVIHHFLGWVDGVTLTFPEGTQVVEVPCVVVSGTSGGDCEPVEILDNVVKIGVTDNSQTQFGHFHEGGEDWLVIIDINTFTLPLSVDWEAHDDGYAGGQNETGTTVVDTIGYASRLAKLWNLFDVTEGELSLEDVSIVNGVDLFPPRDDLPTIVPNPIVDGLQINAVVSYKDLINFTYLELYSPTGLTELTSFSNTETLDIQNYTIFGGVVSSKAIDNFGVGTNDLALLTDDYELRFTGIYDSTLINGQQVYFVSSGGQMATVFRMVSGSDLADHPLNPNPGVAEPFLLRIPFEVWNVEDPENPYQVNLTFRDRVRDGSENPFWAWNPVNRMYSIIVNSPYDPTQVIQVDAGPDSLNDTATWVLVHYGTNYHLDDIVTIVYRGPIHFGVDKFTFTAPPPVDTTRKIIPNDYELYQNYPNPFNPATTIRFDIPNNEKVTLEVFDILGQRVAKLIDGEMQAGRYELIFNGARFSSGIYIYRLITGSYIKSKKMVLLK